MKSKIASENDRLYLDNFLLELGKKLDNPSEKWPTIRCWSKPSIKQLIQEIQNELTHRGLEPRFTPKALIEWLTRIGLAHPIPVDTKSYYVLELGAGALNTIEPLELLMAARPNGVICYFSAVAFHGLTTQPVAHHHIAVVSAKPDTHNGTTKPARTALANGSPFGSLLFYFQNIPFFSTRRSNRFVPGFQIRNYGPRSRIRITTLEQTLLDTLSKPHHCGGPEVVFEAWQEGIQCLDEIRLGHYLNEMKHPPTVRRVAVLLEMLDHSPGSELTAVFKIHQDVFHQNNNPTEISLLPGMPYRNCHKDWLVNTP